MDTWYHLNMKLENKKIEQIKNNEFGEARIDNPRILDLIAEIEYCDFKDKEKKERMIQHWKTMVEDNFQVILESFKEKPMSGVIYGDQGWDRFEIGIDGNIRLINQDTLKAKVSALKRAKELGMKISGSL